MEKGRDVERKRVREIGRAERVREILKKKEVEVRESTREEMTISRKREKGRDFIG